ncbi:RHS repeat-associated core domain-containing protein [Pseudomonas sp. LS_2]|uniref:RHS repeat-associated core domain-containing protein n=1 Tax=Pseudomonas sp. LS_2 TaxID=3055789 RepID=UPI00364B9B26
MGRNSSSLLATDLAQSIVQRVMPDGQSVPIAYTVYGYSAQISNLSSPIALNGELYNALTQNYWLGNGRRMFSPSLMRFCSTDTLSPFGVGGVNSYAYSSNDPVNFHDPSGNFRIPIWAKELASAKPFQSLKSIYSRPARPKLGKFTEGTFSWTERVGGLAHAAQNMKPKKFDEYFNSTFPGNDALRDAVSATNALRIASTPPGGAGLYASFKRASGRGGWGGEVTSKHFRGVTRAHADRLEITMKHWATEGKFWFKHYSTSSDLTKILDYFQNYRLEPKALPQTAITQRIQNLRSPSPL